MEKSNNSNVFFFSFLLSCTEMDCIMIYACGKVFCKSCCVPCIPFGITRKYYITRESMCVEKICERIDAQLRFLRATGDL